MASEKTKLHKIHSISDTEPEDMDTGNAKGRKSPRKRVRKQEKTTDNSDTEPEDDVPQKKRKTHNAHMTSPTGQTLCKYWEECYRRDPDHHKKYLHPTGTMAKLGRKTRSITKIEDMDTATASTSTAVASTSTKSEIKPKNKLKNGEEVEISSDDKKYKIKCAGDHYYCICYGWKTQNRPVNSRTCKHLKSYLGEDYEENRIKEDNESGTVIINRAPRHKAGVNLLLAHKYTDSTNPKNWWMSEKLDGVRAFWDGKSFYSRLGNEFIPPPWFTKGLPSDMTLDGELFGGRSMFQSTVSIVKNPGSGKWKSLTYEVFDAPSLGAKPFEVRVDAIKEFFSKNNAPYGRAVKQTKCEGREQVDKELKRIIGFGGEGLMIREPKSQYEHTRSKTLLKIKTFYDAEARVIGYEAGKGSNTGKVGALVCVMACGKQFKVGSGLTNAQRSKPPKKGSIITYKFQELTNSGSPRFPSFLGIRIDMTEPKDAVMVEKKTEDA